MATEQMNLSDEKLVIPAKDQPSLINKGFFQGWFFGGLVGAAAVFGADALGIIGPGFTVDTLSGNWESLADFSKTSVSYGSMLANSAIGISASLVGGLIGGSAEKAKMKEDLVTGKEVKEPSFWNKNIFKGLFVAEVVSSIALYAGFAPAALGAAPGIIAAGIMGSLGITLLSYGVGFFKGGFDGKAQMQEEYDQALALKDQAKGIAQARDREAGVAVNQPQQSYAVAPSYKNSVSAEEALSLNAQLKQGNPATAAFAQHVEAARAVSAEQANVKG